MESEKYLRYCRPCKCGKNPNIEYKLMRIGHTYLVLITIGCPNNEHLLNYNFGHDNPIMKSELEAYSHQMVLGAFSKWNIL